MCISPIDEFGEVAFGILELRYELCAEHAGIHGNPDSANHCTRHRHMDRVSGDTDHLMYSSSPAKEGAEGATSMNDTQSKLHIQQNK